MPANIGFELKTVMLPIGSITAERNAHGRGTKIEEI